MSKLGKWGIVIGCLIVFSIPVLAGTYFQNGVLHGQLDPDYWFGDDVDFDTWVDVPASDVVEISVNGTVWDNRGASDECERIVKNGSVTSIGCSAGAPNGTLGQASGSHGATIIDRLIGQLINFSGNTDL